MLARGCLLAAVLVMLAGIPAIASAAGRLALVIGNDAYENVPVLHKARNDARSMAQTLTGLGYEVIAAEDVGRRAMSRALVELEGRITGGETVLFFFAGHGFAIDGTNYLLPVDVPGAGPGEEGLVRDAAFSASGVAGRIRGRGAATAILILDACRDNPFAREGTRGLGGAATRGLARMDPTEGMFVLYSAGAGQAALDRLSDADAHPNSVFTRVLLSEIAEPGHSMVELAKLTQARVRDLAARVGHQQTPAYYDQIIGDLFLVPEGAEVAGAGALQEVREGAGESVLPDLPGERLAALEIEPGPVANFSRSNSGWTVSLSLPEPAIQFGYRIGEDGEWVDPGVLDTLDQRTGQKMPKTHFSLPPDQGKTTVYVTWRDPRGEQADIHPIAFDPVSALIAGQKQILDEFWTSWIAFNRSDSLLVYFTHLVSYRCAIREVRYAINHDKPRDIYVIPPCDPGDPHAVPPEASIYRTIPPKTRMMSVQLTYADGTRSQVRTFNVPQ
jgi:hypothetical protein